MQDEIKVWRNMTLFDGNKTFPDKMVLEVTGDKITNLEPESIYTIKPSAKLMGSNKLITPGFIDCHTHIVYAGNRAQEFKMRLEGVSYEQIAKNGGGILSTVTATRSASEDELITQSLSRLDALLADGITTIEIKSGYGLTVHDELKMLRVARKLGRLRKVRVITTLLAAHTVPPEYKNNADNYVDLICGEIIPLVAQENLADAVDVFCETIAFSVEQCEKIFQCARQHNLPIKAHAEQLSNLGGAQLAAKYDALSVDHIEYLDEAGVCAIKQSGTVAVLLPGAFYMLHEKQLPPINLLRKHNVALAIATDANPGSSPIYMPSLVLNMACNLFGLTPTESLQGITSNAAQALNLQKQGIGILEKDNVADFCVWNANSVTDLCYEIMPGRLHQRIFGGEITNV